MFDFRPCAYFFLLTALLLGCAVQEAITSNCNENVWAIDVGMSRYYGGKIEVLEIVNDEVVAVLPQ